MCLILFAYRVHPDYPLVVAANRDERHARPTAQAGFWEDQPRILAGRDLKCMGTWMGVTRGGRFAAVTNYRDPSDTREGAQSRGTLVRRFLAGNQSPLEYLQEVAIESTDYRGFNLLAGDEEELFYYSNRGAAARRLGPGVYGLSNHLLNTPWPKVRNGRARLEAALAPAPAFEPIFTLLADTATAAVGDLPHTGIDPARERRLSAALIVSPDYGTRCSTVLMKRRDCSVRYAERSYSPQGTELDTVRYEF